MFALHPPTNLRASCSGSARTTRLVVRAQPTPYSTNPVQPEEVASTSYSQDSQARPLERSDWSRRTALLCAVLGATAPSAAQAAGFQKTLKKKKLTPEDYSENAEVGLRTYELEEGRGTEIKEGDRVIVHYDCMYRGLDVVSSRSARLLGGNRTIAEPYEFIAGEPTLGVAMRKINDGANGLFAGQGGPKPPPALSKAVLGMKRGGKRIVLVDDPTKGYPKGELEIPVGATFELKVEVLEVVNRAA